MVTIMFLILCAAVETFFLYALVRFGCESGARRRSSRNGSSNQARIWVPSVVFGGPHPVAIWSEGTWDYILSAVDVSQSARLDAGRS
jgi:hypothetical protein